MPADGHVGFQALTYHLLVLLDDHVGIRPQEDVKIQHSPDGPPGQARSRLQCHFFWERKEEKKDSNWRLQPPWQGPSTSTANVQGNREIIES